MADIQRAQHLQIQNRWLKVIPPARGTNELGTTILCLHGWTGDEHSMDVFVRRLPDTCWILAPRAPHSAPEKDLQVWLAHLALPRRSVNILGFSQGAAMALTYTILYPEQVNRVAALSGFLPEGANVALQAGRLSGKTLFLAHGVRDEIVPVARAHESVELLKSAGANVLLCLEKTGHRTGIACLQGMIDCLTAPQ